MDFKDEMSQKIGYWLDSRRNASLQVLARLSGVSYSTLRRIEQKEVHASLENTMQLLEVLMPRDEARAFVKRHFPDLAFLIEDEPKPVEEGKEREPERREEFLLQALAANREGMSAEAAERRLGERARDLLDSMCRGGLLTVRGDRYFARRPSHRTTKRSLLYLTWLLELFDGRPVGAWGSLAKIRTEGLSLEALREVHRIVNDMLHRLDDLFQDPRNHGPHVIGLGLFSTSLGPNQELQDKEGYCS